MTTEHTYTIAGIKLAAAAAAAAAAVIVGSMVLVGWAFDIAVLKSILPGWVSMKPNTAFCFILTGVALLLTAIPTVAFNLNSAIRNPHSIQSAILSRLARLCGWLAGLIGLLTLGEYLFGWNPGIDQWLIRAPADTVGTSHPGRMASETALDFVLLSVALRIADISRQTRYTILASVSLGLLVVALALAALLSHATPGLGAYGWFGITHMAVNTAILFALLGMAVIAISWQPEVLSWSISRNTTAAFACGMAVLVFIGLNTSRSQFWMKETSGRIAHIEQMQGDIESLQAEAIDAHVHARDYLITGEERFLKLYLSAIADSNTKFDELRRVELATGEAAHQQHFARIDAQVNAQFQWLQQMMDARRTGMTDAARNNMIDHADGLLDGLRATFGQVKSDHHQRTQQLKQEAENVSRFVSLITFTGTLASLLIFLIVVFRLNFAVNERKQKELALRESEARLRNIVETTSDWIWEVDENAVYTYVSPKIHDILGYEVAEIIGKTPFDLMPPGEAKRVADIFGPIAAARKPFTNLENTNLHKDGHPVVLETSGVPIIDAQGKCCGYRGIDRDITERKRTEGEYRTLIQTSLDGFWINDFSGRILDVNEALCQKLGYTREELLCMSIQDIEVSETPEETAAHIQKIIQTGGDQFQTQHRRKDGVVIDVEVSVQCHAELGERFFAFLRDITERKRAEDKLRESNERYDLVVKGTSDGIWDWDIRTNTNYFSPRFLELLGYESDEKENKLATYEKFLHPEDRAWVFDRVRQHLEDNVPYNVEYRMRTKNGEYKWFLSRGQAVRDKSGKPVRMAGSITDITERKQAESRFNEQFDELRRWHEATLGMGMRNIELKREVNKLQGQAGQSPRYPSAEASAE